MSSFLTGKKIILLGFIVVLLFAIPLVIYLIQQQKSTSIVPSSNLSYSPSSQSVAIGQSLAVDVKVDPGTNQVSLIKLFIFYDATKLATAEAGFTPNTSAFPSVVEGPVYGPGTITVTLSTGGNSQNSVQKPTTVGTLNFIALASTDTAPTQISFGNQTQIFTASSANSQFNQNILASTSPSNITITGNSPTLTPTPIQTPVPTVAVVPTAIATPVPTVAVVPTAIATPSPTTVALADQTATPSPTITQQINGSLPVCSSLTANPSIPGIVPYNVNFTLLGSSANSTINDVNFNFGDGQTQIINQSQGIGSSSVNLLQSHVYNYPGTFIATATLTDANGNISPVGNCTVTITVSASSSAIAAVSPLPPTGPSGIIGIGIIGIILVLVGGIILLAL